MIICALFQCLYGLSWAILFGAVVLMCFRPSPSNAMLEAILTAILGAFCYIAVYFVLRGIVRLFGSSHPAVPIPPAPVRVRRLIIEEIIPYDGGEPVHRLVGEEIAPSYERHDDAR